MKQNQRLKSNLLLTCLAILMSPCVIAQISEDLGETTPAAETEIICFAAKNQWVCAPADEKQKAHNKAMKLAQQSDEKSAITAPNPAGVEIQTLNLNNIAEQVQENNQQLKPDLVTIEEATKDFIPREDVNLEPSVTSKASGPEPSPIREEVVTATQDISSAPQATVGPSSTEPPAMTRLNNDFADWQSNHPNLWSFQVVGTSNRHHLDQFIVDQGIDARPHVIVKTQVNGANWWVVLCGLYDSREQALSQRNQLPEQLAGNAWVRQIKTVLGQAD